MTTTGQQYLSRLNDGRNVWINGEAVKDVRQHSAFQGPVQTFTKLLDLQDQPEFKNQLTYLPEGSKTRASLHFLVPQSKEDIQRKNKAYRIWSDQTFGVMSRLSEYTRCLLTGWYASRHLHGGPSFAEKIERYYIHSRDNNLLSTAAGHDPQIDRSKTVSQQIDPQTGVHIVRETEDGIVVSGARLLATAAPYVDEIFVSPYHKKKPGEEKYANFFAVSVNTPGVHLISRESFASHSKDDHPLSARFDEMDSVLVFDEALIPWEKVFIKDDPEAIWKLRNDLAVTALSYHQTVIRLISKLEFVTAVANELAIAIGVTQHLHIQEKLAELIIQLETVKGLLVAAEEQAQPNEGGVWLPAIYPLETARNLGTRYYPRALEILQQIGAGGLLQIPSQVSEVNGPVGPFIQKYYGGADRNATERIELFKLAWDLIGSPLASRHELYERFYSGDPVRTYANQYIHYDKTPFIERVKELIGG